MDLYSLVVPAKAGTHLSAVSGADQWIPAFAGMTVRVSGRGPFLLLPHSIGMKIEWRILFST